MIKKLLKIFFVFLFLSLWQLSGFYPLWKDLKTSIGVKLAEAATETKWASSHLTGTFTNPNNALSATNNTWAGQLNTNSSQTSIWAMENPSSGISGTQTIAVLAKKGSNSGTPTIAINLYENGSLVQSVVSATNVTSTTGQTISGTFDGSVITNQDNVEIEVVMTAASGSPSARNSAQIDSISWTVNLATNQSPTLSISQPDGTNDSVVVGSSYSITYTLSDPDNVVTAAFYYDTDNTGLNGTAVSGACATAAEGTNATCSWDTTGVSPGNYYIYGIADDGVNSAVSAYSSGQITISAVSVSVTISTDGTISYGTLTSGQSQDTVSLTDTQAAQNDGNVTEDFNIKTSAPAGWTLGSSASTDTFVHEFSTNSGGNWTKLTTADSYQTLTTSVATSGTQNFDLRLTAPNPSTTSTQKTITITVQAVQH